MKLTIAALGAFLLATACAPTATHIAAAGSASTARSACFNTDFLGGYTKVDNDTIVARGGISREYELDLLGPGCQNIQWSHAFAIVVKPSPWICPGDKVGAGDIQFSDNTSGVTACRAIAVRPYLAPMPAPKS
jgi:hypothetical protein